MAPLAGPYSSGRMTFRVDMARLSILRSPDPLVVVEEEELSVLDGRRFPPLALAWARLWLLVPVPWYVLDPTISSPSLDFVLGGLGRPEARVVLPLVPLLLLPTAAAPLPVPWKVVEPRPCPPSLSPRWWDLDEDVWMFPWHEELRSLLSLRFGGAGGLLAAEDDDDDEEERRLDEDCLPPKAPPAAAASFMSASLWSELPLFQAIMLV